MLETPTLPVPEVRTIPGPKPRRFGIPSSARIDPTAYLSGLARDYGDVVHFRFGPLDAYLLNHPDLIRDVLVTNSRQFMKGEGLQRAKRVLGEGLLTSEGEFHLKQRRLLQPVFLKNHIQNYADAMGRQAQKTAARWQDGATVDISREMGRLTLAVVGETLFSADVEGEAQELGAALDTSLELFDKLSSPLAPLFDLLPFGPSKTFKEARGRLDATIYRLIEEHNRADNDNGDLLSLLLSARYDDGSAMDKTQVRDEAMTIFLAGHETTANALTWTWVLLARHPEIAAKVQEEAQRVLADRAATYADLEQLVFTRQVISESMRLYPPAWVVGRKALQDYEIEHEGARYVIPQNALVLTSQWVMHHDPRFWDEPEKFRPERWEGESNRPKFAYFPFGGGPRQCIGEGFAWMEAVLLFAGLAAHWKASLVDDGPIELRPRITLRPAGAVNMVMTDYK
jgi:cytochrome P450